MLDFISDLDREFGPSSLSSSAGNSSDPGEGEFDLDGTIDEKSRQYGVDPALVRAMIRQESNFDPSAISPKGAVGYMQLMPETAKELGVDPADPVQNIDGGVRYIKGLLDRNQGNVDLALAAYNAGQGRVNEYGGVPPFKETQDYVQRIKANYQPSSSSVSIPVSRSSTTNAQDPYDQIKAQLAAATSPEFLADLDKEFGPPGDNVAAAGKKEEPGLGAGLKTAAAGALELPRELVAAAVSAYRGGDIETEPGIVENFLKYNRKKSEEFQKKYGGEGNAFLGLTMDDFAQLPQNLAFSAVSAIAGLGGGIAASPVPVPGSSIAAGMATSGYTAYRMAKDQVSQSLFDMLNEQSQANRGKPVTQEEWESIRSKLSGQIDRYGLWEAIPEALGNALEFKIITTPVKSFLKIPAIKNKLLGALVKAGSLYGGELTTESITQKGQGGVEAELGMRDRPPTWGEAIGEVAGPVALTTTVLGGAGNIASGAYERAKERAKGAKVEPGAEGGGPPDVSSEQAVQPETQPSQEPATEIQLQPQPTIGDHLSAGKTVDLLTGQPIGEEETVDEQPAESAAPVSVSTPVEQPPPAMPQQPLALPPGQGFELVQPERPQVVRREPTTYPRGRQFVAGREQPGVEVVVKKKDGTEYRLPTLGQDEMDMLDQALNEVQSADRPQLKKVGEEYSRLKSGYPEWFRNKGWNKGQVLVAVKNAQNGRILTENQAGLISDILDHKREEWRQLYGYGERSEVANDRENIEGLDGEVQRRQETVGGTLPGPGTGSEAVAANRVFQGAGQAGEEIGLAPPIPSMPQSGQGGIQNVLPESEGQGRNPDLRSSGLLHQFKEFVRRSHGDEAAESIRPAEIRSKRQQAVDAIAQEFGIKVVWYDTKHSALKDVNGATLSAPGTVAIKTNSPHPALAVLGHETLHVVQKEHPDLYRRLWELHIQPEQFEVYAEFEQEKRREGGFAPLSDEEIADEFFADFSGDQFLNPEWWNGLYRKDPGIAQKLADVVKRVLQQIRRMTMKVLSKGKEMRDPGMLRSEYYFEDLKKAQDVLSGVMKEFRARKQRGGRAQGVVDEATGAPFSYAGPKAKGWNEATGKFSSLYDKKERFEISDHDGKVKVPLDTDFEGRLRDAYDHPELYANYPELKNLPVEVNISDAYHPQGEYLSTPDKIIVWAQNEQQAKKTLVHEVQHWVQGREGFARGGSPRKFAADVERDKARLLEVERHLQRIENQMSDEARWILERNDKSIIDKAEKLAEEYGDYTASMTLYEKVKEYLLENDSSYKRLYKEAARLKYGTGKLGEHERYRRLAGEIEARDVSARADMTPEERRKTPPYSSENIAPEDAIVQFGSSNAAMVPEKESTFDLDVDRFLRGELKSGEFVTVGETPKVLRKLGAEDVPMIITQDALAKIIKEKSAGGKHGLPIEVVKQIPEQIKNPIMVFESASGENGLVIMTELQHKGHTVIAAIHLSKTVRRNIVNKVASIYGKDADQWFRDQVENGLLRYVNKEKSRAWFMIRGLQLPKMRGTKHGLKVKILTNEDLVKRENEKERKPRLSISSPSSSPAATSSPKSITGDKTTDSFLAKIGQQPQTLQEKVRTVYDALLDRWKLRAEQSLFDRNAVFRHYDQAANITDVAKDGSYIAARMIPSPGNVMNSLLKYGPLRWLPEGGYIHRDPTAGIESLIDEIGRHDEHGLQKFFGWRVARRAARLLLENKEKLFAPEEINAGLRLIRGKEAQFKKWDEQLKKINNAVLDFAERAGVVSADQRALFKDDWQPFYRIQEAHESIKGPHSKRSMASQYSGIRRLTGGENRIGDPIENLLMNWLHLTDAAIKNDATRKALKNAAGSGVVKKAPHEFKPAIVPRNELRKFVEKNYGEILESAGIDPSLLDLAQLEEMHKLIQMQKPAGKDVVHVLLNGKPAYYRIEDPLLLRALTGINETPWNDPVIRIMRRVKRIFTQTITIDPAFKAANWMRDTLQTFTLSDGFVPFVDSVKGLVKTFREDPDYAALHSTGALFENGYWGATPKEAQQKVNKLYRKHKIEESSILNTTKRIWEFYQKLDESSENSARIAIYQNMRKKGKSHFEAAYEAKDIMDFGLRGDAQIIRFLVETVPFLGARIQGLQRMYRGARMNPNAFITKGLMIAGASLALYAINKDDDRYKELEEWDKDNYYHFFVGDGHYRLPKPFEVGAIWSTIPERLTDTFFGEGNARLLGDRILAMFRDTFAFQPPQIVGPALEQYANKSWFTGRPIVGMGLHGLQSRAEEDPWTSETLAAVGDKLNWSPKRMEAWVRGYFGTLGMYLVAVSDAAVRRIWDYPAEPSMRMDDIPLIKRFVQDAPAKHTKYVTAFYDMLNEVDELHNTFNKYKKEGKIDKAKELYQAEKKKLTRYDYLNKVGSQMRKINNQVKMIHMNPFYTPEKKRELIDKWTDKKNRIAKMAYDRAGAEF